MEVAGKGRVVENDHSCARCSQLRLLQNNELIKCLFNHTLRKYVLVDPRKTSFEGGLKDLGQCFKVFVNVLASSRNEPRAVICCGYPQEGSSSHVWSHYDDDSVSFLGICPQLPSSVANSPLPFLGRLTRFPDALIIPLFPLLIRIAVRTYQTSMENAYLNTTTFGVYSFRRFTLYFLLMIFRACVLYVGLNKVLGNFDSTSQTRNDVNGYDDESSNGTATCWYGEWLQETQQSCHGRRFDFSDHIVLFLGQLLPIALVECLHSLDRPYWSFHLYHQRYSLPLLLTAGMVYLYFVTLVGVYKTASYFHTPIECLVGVAISLSSQIPLYLLQCSTRLESVAKLREYFFGRTLS